VTGTPHRRPSPRHRRHRQDRHRSPVSRSATPRRATLAHPADPTAASQRPRRRSPGPRPLPSFTARRSPAPNSTPPPASAKHPAGGFVRVQSGCGHRARRGQSGRSASPFTPDDTVTIRRRPPVRDLAVAKADQTIAFRRAGRQNLLDAPFAVQRHRQQRSWRRPRRRQRPRHDRRRHRDAHGRRLRSQSTATQTGDANYNAAPVVSRSFAVAKGRRHRHARQPRPHLQRAAPKRHGHDQSRRPHRQLDLQRSATAPTSAGSYTSSARSATPITKARPLLLVIAQPARRYPSRPSAL